MARALMLVASNSTDADRTGEFNDWYARHIDELLQVEGIVSATRWEASSHQLLPSTDGIEGRRFLALYEIECDDVGAVRNRIRDPPTGFSSHPPTSATQRAVAMEN